MTAAEKLRIEYEEKLQVLQDTCSHEVLTDWMQEYWAFGHSTGASIRCCQNCDKIIDKIDEFITQPIQFIQHGE